MTNIRARNLFTAILVARAICGIGAAQADWVSADKTSGPGHIVTGTDVCTNLASYLDVNYNDVTMQAGATSSETLPFRVSDMSNPTADVLGNTLGIGGSVTTSYADGVVFEGYRVNDNTVTVDSSGSITNKLSSGDVTGILLDAWTEASDNNVYNHGSISGFDEGIGLQARDTLTDTLTDNIVFNDGQITGGDIGIHFEANHISGAGITDSSGNLADSVTNSGILSVAGVGIQLEAGEDITDVRVTNTSGGTISSKAGVGIALSAEGDISGTEIYNAGSIEGKYSGVLLAATHVSDNDVVNSGNITSNTGGILVRYDDSAENNRLTNAGTLKASMIGLGIRGTGDASGNKLKNMVDGQISAQVGLGIDTSGNATYNELTNDGAIVADGVGMSISAMGTAFHNVVENTGSIDVSGNADDDLFGIRILGAYGDVAENTVTNAYNAEYPTNLRVSATSDEESDLTASGIALQSYSGKVHDNLVTNNGYAYVDVSVEDTGGSDSVDIQAEANGIVLFSSTDEVGKNTVTNYDVDVFANSHAGVGDAYTYQSLNLDNEATANGIEVASISGDTSGNTVSGGYVQAAASAEADGVYADVHYASFSLDNTAVANGITVHSDSGEVTGNPVSSYALKATANTDVYAYDVQVFPDEETPGAEPVQLTLRNEATANGIEIYSSTGNVSANPVTSSYAQVEANSQVEIHDTSGAPLVADNQASANGISIHSVSGDVSGNSILNGTLDASGNPVPSGYTDAMATADLQAEGIYDGGTLTNRVAVNAIDVFSNSGDVLGNTATSESLLAEAIANASFEDSSGVTFDIDNWATSRGVTFGSSIGDVIGNKATNSGIIHAESQANASMEFSVGEHFDIDNETASNGVTLYGMEGNVSGNRVTSLGSIHALAATTTGVIVYEPSGGTLNLDSDAAANGITLYSYTGDVLDNIVESAQGGESDGIVAQASAITSANAGGSSVSGSLNGDATAAGIELLSYMGKAGGNQVTNGLGITATATSTVTDVSGALVNINMDSEASAAGIMLLGGAGCGEVDLVNHINHINTVANSGSIVATAISNATTTDLSGNLDSSADATGIGLRSQLGGVTGNIVGNTGIISVLAQASASATDASGGSIDSDVSARAVGIELGSYLGDVSGNQVTNAGTINVIAVASQSNTAGQPGSQADGILLFSGSGDIVLAGPEPSGGKISGNVVNLAGTSSITSTGDGVHLEGGDTVSGNWVTNAGLIDA